MSFPLNVDVNIVVLLKCRYLAYGKHANYFPCLFYAHRIQLAKVTERQIETSTSIWKVLSFLFLKKI